VVLYFYPKDDTPGCTKEACSFRDNLKAIREMGSEVVGISVDDVDSHKKFTEKYHLPFPLVSDPDKKIATAYGVLRDPPTMTNRVTFIIDKNGKIANIFPKVDVTQHTEEVVAALKKLG
jgi:peroxiredoxin Q/BCP